MDRQEYNRFGRGKYRVLNFNIQNTGKNDLPNTEYSRYTIHLVMDLYTINKRKQQVTLA